MHVMKILYIASIYGLVTETKKNYSGFYEKPLQNNFEKKFTAIFVVKPLKKPFYSGF
jgi:hypothetical protein